MFGAFPSKQGAKSEPLKEYLLSDEELDHDLFFSRNARLQQRSWHFRTPSCFQTLVCVVLSVILVQAVTIWKLWHPILGPEVLGEINGFVPSVGIKSKLFLPDPSFNPLNMTDPGWIDVMPRGGGFVPIRNWQDADLPDPIVTRGKDVYNVAVFHQLHCLHILAEIFANFMTGSQDTGHAHGSHAGPGGAMLDHAHHCFEYIKESLTCCADTALEGQKQGTTEAGTDGFGAHHVCRDFDAVYEWADAHRVSDLGGYPH